MAISRRPLDVDNYSALDGGNGTAVPGYYRRTNLNDIINNFMVAYVGDDKILNIEGLRYKNEFVMHKILDCMGDLMLANYKILGRVNCSQGGHQLTIALLKEFLSDSKYFSIVEFKEKKLPNSSFYSRPVAASA